MDEEKDQLLEELLQLRTRAEEIGRRLQELEKKERRSRLWVIPGGATALAVLGAVRKHAAKVSVVAAVSVALLLAAPGGEVSRDHRAAPRPARPPRPVVAPPPAHAEPPLPVPEPAPVHPRPVASTDTRPATEEQTTPTAVPTPATVVPEAPEVPDETPSTRPHPPILQVSVHLDALARVDLRIDQFRP